MSSEGEIGFEADSTGAARSGKRGRQAAALHMAFAYFCEGEWNVNSIDFVSFGAIVTVWSWAPKRSCQASTVYVPGGRFFSANSPDFEVMSKYGCAKTKRNERIQG